MLFYDLQRFLNNSLNFYDMKRSVKVKIPATELFTTKHQSGWLVLLSNSFQFPIVGKRVPSTIFEQRNTEQFLMVGRRTSTIYWSDKNEPSIVQTDIQTFQKCSGSHFWFFKSVFFLIIFLCQVAAKRHNAFGAAVMNTREVNNPVTIYEDGNFLLNYFAKLPYSLSVLQLYLLYFIRDLSK